MDIKISIYYEMPEDFSKEPPVITKQWEDFYNVLESLCNYYGLEVKKDCIDAGCPDDVGSITYRERIFTVSIQRKGISFTHGFAELVEGLSKIYRPYFRLLDISYALSSNAV